MSPEPVVSFDISFQVLGPIFGPEKYLSSVSPVEFADALLVHSLMSNLDRKCRFEHFESGPKLQFAV